MPLRRAGTVTNTALGTAPAQQRTASQELRAALRPGHLSASCAGLTRASITLHKTLSKWMDCRVKPGNDALASECPRDGVLCVALYLPQMRFAAETLRVDLVDVLGARGPRGEPAVVGGDLDAAERLAV